MNRGALSLATYPFDDVRIACEACGREERYRRSRLIERFWGEHVHARGARQDHWRLSSQATLRSGTVSGDLSGSGASLRRRRTTAVSGIASGSIMLASAHVSM
jgi:hypothetical protein